MIEIIVSLFILSCVIGSISFAGWIIYCDLIKPYLPVRESPKKLTSYEAMRLIEESQDEKELEEARNIIRKRGIE